MRGYGAVVTKTVTVKPLKGAPSSTVFCYDKEEKNLFSGAEDLKLPNSPYAYFLRVLLTAENGEEQVGDQAAKNLNH